MICMEALGFRRLSAAALLLLSNLMLGELLGLPTSLITLMLTVNASHVIVFGLGVLVGLLGDVTVIAAEGVVLTVIHFMRLGNISNLSILTYVVLPYLVGVAAGSSFFRRTSLTMPKASAGWRSLGDLLMILGSSLIATYFISLIPTLNRLVIGEALSGLRLYLFICGLVCNSFVTSLTVQPRFDSLRSFLTLTLVVATVTLSWASTPSIVLISLNYLEVGGNYIILGRVIRKFGVGVGLKRSIGGYVKIPISGPDNRHMVIVGMSGSGKSYLAMKIVKQLAGRHPVLIIDPHGEYVGLVRELKGKVLTPIGNPVNPLDTLGKPINVRAEEVSDMIRRVFRLGNVQKYSLYALILNTYERLGGVTPTFNDVYLTLIKHLEGGPSSEEVHLSKEVLSTLIPYLDLLRNPYSTSTALRPEDLVEGLTVVDLSVVESEFLISVYVESLLHLLESYIKTSGKGLFIIVDEAHRFMGGKVAPLLSKLVMEGRKFGVRLVVVTQQPLDLETGIVANSAYVISFAIREVNNLNYISRILCTSDVKYELVRDLVSNLKKHDALVRIRDEGGLYLIKT